MREMRPVGAWAIGFDDLLAQWRPPLHCAASLNLAVHATWRVLQFHSKIVVFGLRVNLALGKRVVCIVGITRLMPRVHQPDPPGLIHDDPRLLPPWRGSSHFRGDYRRYPQRLGYPHPTFG